MTLGYHLHTVVLIFTISQHITWGNHLGTPTNPKHEWVKMVERSFLDDKIYPEELGEMLQGTTYSTPGSDINMHHTLDYKSKAMQINNDLSK